MTPEQLTDILRTEETSHVEVIDAILEAIRWIDRCVEHLEREPEMELTRAVLAATCMAWTLDTDPDDQEDAAIEYDAAINALEFARRIETAIGVFKDRWHSHQRTAHEGLSAAVRDRLARLGIPQPLDLDA